MAQDQTSAAGPSELHNTDGTPITGSGTGSLTLSTLAAREVECNLNVIAAGTTGEFIIETSPNPNDTTNFPFVELARWSLITSTGAKAPKNFLRGINALGKALRVSWVLSGNFDFIVSALIKE